MDPENATETFWNGGMVMKKKMWAVFLAGVLLVQTFGVEVVMAAEPEETEGDVVRSLDEVPDISDETPLEDQIVILYEEPEENNVKALGLDEEEIAEGESVSDSVDVITPEEGVDTDALIQELEETPGVAAASRNKIMEVDALPNDPGVSKAWQFQKIGADKVWNQLGAHKTVKVAVIDTGVNMNHEDLRGRCEIGYDYVADTGASMRDVAGHGTLVAGTIAATANNGIGFPGVVGAADIKVVAYRTGGITSTDRGIRLDYAMSALMDVVQRGDIQVVNMSYGSSSGSTVEQAAIQKARDAGVVLVASAGNDGDTSYNYPASFEGVLSVGATTENDIAANFSNRNSMVDLCAPGQEVYTTNNQGGYSWANGTSFSSPITAGAAAVIRYVNQDLSVEQVEKILMDTTRDLGASGRDHTYGYGLIQLDKAVAQAQGTPGAEPLELLSFTTDKASPQPNGSTISLTAQTAGGVGTVSYKFTATKGSTEVIQDYGDNVALWRPESGGTYTLCVYAKDEVGSEVSREISYVIRDEPLEVKLFTSLSAPQDNSTRITLYAETTGGSGNMSYKFAYIFDGRETIIRDYDEKADTTWVGTKAGIYTLRVYAKDEGGQETYCDLEYEITKCQYMITSFTADLEAPQSKGEVITLYAESNFLAPDYKFTQSYEGGEEQIISDFALFENEVEWIPDKVGTYTLRVYAEGRDRDEGNYLIVSDEMEYEVVERPPLKVKLNFLDEGEEVVSGKGYYMEAEASGGTEDDYSYRFTYTYNGVETEIVENESGRTYEWLDAPGAYVFTVYLTDSSGETVSDSVYINVGPGAIRLYLTCPERVDLGEACPVEFAAEGGLGTYQYKFTVKPFGGEVVTLQEYSINNKLEWRPMYINGYTMTLWVKDELGTEASKEFSISVDRPYGDVATPDWYWDAVEYVYARGIMTGLNSNVFGPLETLPRAQFAVILHRLNDAPAVNYTAKFKDVGAGIWYTDAILWAAQTGVVTGYSNGNFGPGDPINREQMAVMMYRYAGYKGYDISARADFSGYKDASRVSGFAREAMQWAVGTGIISGKYDQTMLDPGGHASRAECATIMMRFMELYES